MKAVIAAVCVAALLGAYVLTRDSATPSVDSQFEDFITTYRKSYLNQETYNFRLGVFQANLEEIERLNRENPSATYGVNHFADLTEEERIAAMGLKTFSGLKSGKVYQATGNRKTDTVDWVAAGESTAVKDQKSCGSCWSFSGTETLESAWAIANGKSASQIPLLSEQLFVDCAKAPEFGSNGCNGGWMDDVFSYAQKYEIATEADYPYMAKDQTCQKSLASLDVGVEGIYNVKEGDLEGLLELTETHPVAIAVDAGSWSFYKSGVHKSTRTALNHGVVLDGYHMEAEQPYLVVKNSWGPRWGMSGYIHLDAYANSGATLAASAPIMKGITYPGQEEPNAKCSDGSDADPDANCDCTYGKACDKKAATNNGCKPECGCGEFGFCR